MLRNWTVEASFLSFQRVSRPSETGLGDIHVIFCQRICLCPQNLKNIESESNGGITLKSVDDVHSVILSFKEFTI